MPPKEILGEQATSPSLLIERSEKANSTEPRLSVRILVGGFPRDSRPIIFVELHYREGAVSFRHWGLFASYYMRRRSSPRRRFVSTAWTYKEIFQERHAFAAMLPDELKEPHKSPVPQKHFARNGSCKVELKKRGRLALSL